jgi:hypothetical protein
MRVPKWVGGVTGITKRGIEFRILNFEFRISNSRKAGTCFEADLRISGFGMQNPKFEIQSPARRRGERPCARREQMNYCAGTYVGSSDVASITLAYAATLPLPPVTSTAMRALYICTVSP